MSSKKADPSTREYPLVKVKERLKKIEITGHSRMTDAGDFYKDLIPKFESYFNTFNKTLILEIRFEYLNTSSVKWVLVLLQALECLVAEHGLVEVYWYYEEDDESILESGEIYKSSLKIPFHLREIS